MSEKLIHAFYFRECGCGQGDSGCAVCGCCRICARESCDNQDDIPILRSPVACGSSQASEFAFRVFLRKRFEEKKQKQWKGANNQLAGNGDYKI